MALTKSAVRIPALDNGVGMRTYTDGDGKHHQAIVLVDADGNQVGIPTNPQFVISTHVDLYRILSGNRYMYAYDFTLGGSGNKQVILKTPNTATRLILSTECDSTAYAWLQIIEAPTVSNNGTAATPVNCDRNSSNVSVATLYYDSTTSSGTTILSYRATASYPARMTMDGNGTFVLKQNTTYCFMLFLASAGSGTIRLFWNEV